MHQILIIKLGVMEPLQKVAMDIKILIQQQIMNILMEELECIR